MNSEESLIAQLQLGNERAYQYLFDHHYPILCHLANRYVKDKFMAETIVDDCIFHLWERRDSLHISKSVRQYLSLSVRNKCLDYLQSQYKQKTIVLSQTPQQEAVGISNFFSDANPLGRLLEKELEEKVMAAISQLPDMCQQVFRLSRLEEKSYEEIARELGISVNTVKYHIKRALAVLHSELSQYLIAVLTCLFTVEK